MAFDTSPWQEGKTQSIALLLPPLELEEENFAKQNFWKNAKTSFQFFYIFILAPPLRNVKRFKKVFAKILNFL